MVNDLLKYLLNELIIFVRHKQKLLDANILKITTSIDQVCANLDIFKKEINRTFTYVS